MGPRGSRIIAPRPLHRQSAGRRRGLPEGMMQAEIVSVGTELLLGHIVDSNAAYLAQELTALGIDLFWVSQVGDNQGRLVEVIRRAWGRSGLIIITGGVGPTEDDLTREAIAEHLDEQMVVNPELERDLRAFFAR